MTGEVVATQTGDFISQANTAVTGSSQALPTPPPLSRVVLIQVHGGTTGDPIYVSFDASAATTSDFVLRNAGDATGIAAPSELYIVGDLADVRIIGTDGNLWVGFFK